CQWICRSIFQSNRLARHKPPSSLKQSAESSVGHDIGASDQRVQNDIEGQDQSGHFSIEAQVCLVDRNHDENGSSQPRSCRKPCQHKHHTERKPRHHVRAVSVKVSVDQKAQECVCNAVPNLLDVCGGRNDCFGKVWIL